uniref:Uncharacterized protein n=1 Tax=viral metagenome TaxID=1070528 RepID=A0A6C0KV59_9ZZZZ
MLLLKGLSYYHKNSMSAYTMIIVLLFSFYEFIARHSDNLYITYYTSRWTVI